MLVGIVGKPNVGKSTFFALLAHRWYSVFWNPFQLFEWAIEGLVGIHPGTEAIPSN